MREAAAREVREETGLSVEVGELPDIGETLRLADPWHGISIAFRGVLLGGD